ncbi:MAG: alpha/beta hydrolase [Mycobacteriaceae bacterium]|uniref:alpha/beta hydrolase n=1 Tax=Corynebacterium sp. TaxID=1720 RepID=UPI003F95BA70
MPAFPRHRPSAGIIAVGTILAVTLATTPSAAVAGTAHDSPESRDGGGHRSARDARPAEIHRDRETPGLTAEESSWRVALDTHPDVEEVWTYSPAMNRDIPLLVQPAGVPDAPTVYLLNGVDGGVDDHTWFGKGGAAEFYRGKGVNVVVPVDGRNSYYTDWLEPSALDRADRGGKRQQWETYLTRELPGPLEESLQANGKRAIMGMSMSATSALLLAQRNPGFYSAVAAVSGCADTTSTGGRATVDYITDDAGATTDQMWGPATGAYARDHDPLLNAGLLHASHQGRELPLFVSVSTGLPTPAEATAPPESQLVGGAIEVGSLYCTVQLDRALQRAGVPATVEYDRAGLHSWLVFARAPQASWPTLQRGLF